MSFLVSSSLGGSETYSVMVTAYIGIGSNMGDRLANCVRAAEEIAAVPGFQVVSCSEWFLTRPVGVDGHPACSSPIFWKSRKAWGV
ncbi:MAG: hypothetical protein CVU64_25140 [Deltaproteobacteria bacterium HGW-Deltaproteobacteria-21]|nr:MAG: hypothetical protein CVU64_25140 [Deltaproteobacteria bacterium HGW-Deltaproteobacteria-21]